MIVPNTGDERDIRFSIPRGQPAGPVTLSALAEGNFEPVRVDVPVAVRVGG